MKRLKKKYVYVLCGLFIFIVLIVLLLVSRTSKRIGYVNDMAELNKTFKFWKPFDFPTEGPLFFVEEGNFLSWGIIVFGNLSKAELSSFLESIPKNKDVTDTGHENMKENQAKNTQYNKYQGLRMSGPYFSTPSFRIPKWIRERIHFSDWKKLKVAKLHSNNEENDYVFPAEYESEIGQYSNIFIEGQLNGYTIHMNIGPKSGQFVMRLWERNNSGH